MIIPDTGLSFSPPLRVFNLSGGLSCLVGDSGLCWLMLPGEYGTFWSELDNKTHQIAEIKNLRKISFQFFENADRLQNDIFEKTYTDVANRDGSLLDESQINRWMGLAVAYRNAGLLRRAIRAERISKQIRFCRNSIDKLHKAYRMCLSEKAAHENITHQGKFHFFSDPFSLNIAFYLQPCLDALFSLRDYVFTFLTEEMYEKQTKLSKMYELLSADDKYNIAELVISAINQTEPYGVVYRVAVYRNSFFHYLGSSAGPLGESYCLVYVDTAFGQIPRVTYPLDDNFERVRSIDRGDFIGYGDREQHNLEARKYMSAKNYVDALDLCFDCFISLMEIAQHMAKHISIESQSLRLEEKDIISAEIIKDGTRRRYERDAEGILKKVEENRE